MRDSARSGCQRGLSPAAEGAPPPRGCAPLAPWPGGNHGVQRGGRGRQRRGGGEGERQEEEAGRPGHGLAHLLQRRHDRGVSGRGRAVGRQRGASAGRQGGAAGAGGSAAEARRGPGDPAGWRSRGAAGGESRGRRGAAGSGLPAGHCLIRCSAASRQRVTPSPPQRLSIAGRGMPAGGAARAASLGTAAAAPPPPPPASGPAPAPRRDGAVCLPAGRPAARRRKRPSVPPAVPGRRPRAPRGFGRAVPGGGSRLRLSLRAHAPRHRVG